MPLRPLAHDIWVIHEVNWDLGCRGRGFGYRATIRNQAIECQREFLSPLRSDG